MIPDWKVAKDVPITGAEVETGLRVGGQEAGAVVVIAGIVVPYAPLAATAVNAIDLPGLVVIAVTEMTAAHMKAATGKEEKEMIESVVEETVVIARGHVLGIEEGTGDHVVEVATDVTGRDSCTQVRASLGKH